jgi:hypothetical protein
MRHARRIALLAVCALATVVLAAGAAFAQGTELWAAHYNGPGSGNDTAKAVVTDAEGNVIVTGAARGAGTRDDWATLKYDRDGNLLWEHRFGGPLDDLARDVDVDENGDVYVAGHPFAVVKYSADGEQLWRTSTAAAPTKATSSNATARGTSSSSARTEATSSS